MERAVFWTILELREEKHEAVRNVATSQRCDILTLRRPNVATSGQHEEEVNKRQRRNISTSRRQCDFSITIIKSKKGPEFEGIEDRTNEGTESIAVVT